MSKLLCIIFGHHFQERGRTYQGRLRYVCSRCGKVKLGREVR